MLGLFIMTVAAILQYGVLWAPALAGTLYFFRFRGTGETWLAAINGRNFKAAMLRGVYILPYGALLYFIDGRIHWLTLAFPLIAILYWASGRILPKQAGELAELLTGVYVGCI